MARAAKLSFYLLAVSLCASGPLYSQQISLPEPEAPTTIFSTTLGDVDVDLNLQGTWDGSVSLTTGLLFAPGLTPQWLDAFPSLRVGPYFIQVPDITASVVLMQKYFLDLSLVQDPTLPGANRGYLAMGYRGDSTEVLRSVMLGNGGVAIPPSGFLEIPDQPVSSLGASALLVSGASSNELLLRWDSMEERVKTFLGPNEIVEETVSPGSYTRGLFFFLPDSGVDPSSLVVYLEDPGGTYRSGSPDNKTYRLATLDDASIDAATGLVSLKTAQMGRVLVYYTKGGLPVGDSSLGQDAIPALDPATQSKRDLTSPVDFNWGSTYFFGKPFTQRRVLIGSAACLLLWEPGDTSPFEIDSSYPFSAPPPSDPSRISITLHAKGAGVTLPAGLSFRPIPDEQRFVVFADADFRADFRNMYPFPDPDGLLYGTPRDALDGYLGYDISVRLLTPANEFLLEPNLVPGSVIVTVNGLPESRFEADSSSGKVTFLITIGATDRVEIRYRVASQGLAGGNLLFAWRDTIALSDALKVSFAAGIRWNADPRAYSLTPYDKSGTILAQAGIEGEGETWSYSVKAGLSYTNPDTSGVMRLFAMEGNAVIVDLSEDNAYPAAAPDPLETFPVPPPGALTQLTRGYLFYKNYRAYDALGGSSLNPIGWSGAVAVTYDNGGRMGPYNVLGSSAGASTGVSLVFDFDIPAGGWVGAQLLPVPGGTADLSSAQSVTLRVRGLGVTAGVTLYLQAGALSEDIDGESPPALQQESSATESGFPFYDQAQAHNVTLKVGGGPKGQGNGRLDSEDRDGNGILDVEEPDLVITLTAPSLAVPASADTGWMTVTMPLDSAMRSRLASTRQLRLIIVSAAGATGQVMVDELSFEGAAEHGAETPAGALPGSVSVREIAESSSAADPGSGSRLQDVFPVVSRMFHPNGETQEVLEALWGSAVPLQTGSGQALTNPLIITGYTSTGTGGIQYDTIVLYFRVVSMPAGAVVSFALTDAGGKGVSWSVGGLDAMSGAWHEMRASKRDGVIRVDGTDVGSAAPAFDSGYASLSKLVITITGAPSGAIMIDEVQCQDPEGSFGAALDAEGFYKIPGVILQSGGVPLLSNLSVHQKVSLVSRGFSTLYGIPYQNEDLSSRTELGVDALFTRIEATLLFREYAGEFNASGGHRIVVPSVPFPVSLTDAFSLSWLGEFSRQDLLSIKPTSWLGVTLDSRADGTADVLSQKWTGTLSLAPVARLSIGSTAEISQALSGYPLPSTWYGERWIREMGLLIPWAGGQDIARGEKLDITLDLPPNPFGFQVAGEALTKSSNFSTASRDQENDLDVSLTLLFHTQTSSTDSFTASLGYQRYVSLMGTFASGERFVADAEQFFRLLSRQGYLVTAVPYMEIFSDNSAEILPLWVEASKARYSPRAALGLQRNYGSRLVDLLLPSSVDLTVGQDLKKDGGLFSTEIFIQPKVSSHAINLFGQLGAYPLLSFARTDEYGFSARASFTQSPGQAFVLTETIVDVYASVEGLSEQLFTLSQSFKWNQTDEPAVVGLEDTTQLSFVWKTRPSGGILIPLISPDIGRTGFLEHTETAALSLRYSSPGSFHPLTALVGHATSLVFPKNGTITAEIDFGFDREQLAAAAFAHRLAVELKLEAKLQF